MCWVHEWARAITNLDWVKIHIERAKIKVEKRTNMQHRVLTTDLEAAVKECEQLIEIMENAQIRLKSLIETYGIFRTNDADSLINKIKIRRKNLTRGKIEGWVQTH